MSAIEGAPAELVRRLRDEPARYSPRDRLDYDLVLDVPRLCIEELRLRVDTLTARVSLDATIANMVRITAGAGVAIGHVDLGLRGVRATALLAVNLADLRRVVDDVMTYLEAHPEVLARVLRERIEEERRAAGRSRASP